MSTIQVMVLIFISLISDINSAVKHVRKVSNVLSNADDLNCQNAQFFEVIKSKLCLRIRHNLYCGLTVQ